MGEEEFNLHNEQRTTSWKFLCLFSSHLCKGTEAFLEKKNPTFALLGLMCFRFLMGLREDNLT